jgi:hypothetical protein
MSSISNLAHWQKKTLGVTITHPVPVREIESLTEKNLHIHDALRTYMYLLILHQQGHSIKMLDTDMKILSELNLYLNTDVPKTRYIAKYTLRLGWRSQRNIDAMKEFAVTKNTDKLLSKAVFVLWDTHEHIKEDGFILLRPRGEKPQTISAADFY